MTALAFLAGFTFFLSDKLWVVRGVSGGWGKSLHFHICNNSTATSTHHAHTHMHTHTPASGEGL